ncbi:MAG TPA: hypothetical protein VK841_26710 [Polyangiaceae bacterium]|nr:hypothetical protein [Polyangiaceae bacterium]
MDGATDAGDTGLLESASLPNGTTTLIARVDNEFLGALGVTASTAFLSLPEGILSVPLTGDLPGGGPTSSTLPGSVNSGCYGLVSDTNSAYCETDSINGSITPQGGAIISLANDGTMTTLAPVGGSASNNGGIAIDGTYVYWTNNVTNGPVTQGSIMRVAKSGGTVTNLANATLPTAIAVDAHAVYWSDKLAKIWRLAK